MLHLCRCKRYAGREEVKGFVQHQHPLLVEKPPGGVTSRSWRNASRISTPSGCARLDAFGAQFSAPAKAIQVSQHVAAGSLESQRLPGASNIESLI